METMAYDILRDKVAYHDLGGDYFDRLCREHTVAYVVNNVLGTPLPWKQCKVKWPSVS